MNQTCLSKLSLFAWHYLKLISRAETRRRMCKLENSENNFHLKKCEPFLLASGSQRRVVLQPRCSAAWMTTQRSWRGKHTDGVKHCWTAIRPSRLPFVTKWVITHLLLHRSNNLELTLSIGANLLRLNIGGAIIAKTWM